MSCSKTKCFVQLTISLISVLYRGKCKYVVICIIHSISTDFDGKHKDSVDPLTTFAIMGTNFYQDV